MARRGRCPSGHRGPDRLVWGVPAGRHLLSPHAERTHLRADRAESTYSCGGPTQPCVGHYWPNTGPVPGLFWRHRAGAGGRLGRASARRQGSPLAVAPAVQGGVPDGFPLTHLQLSATGVSARTTMKGANADSTLGDQVENFVATTYTLFYGSLGCKLGLGLEVSGPRPNIFQI